MSDKKMQNIQKGLDRYLFPVDAWAIGFGCAVGWGASVMPGTTFLPLAGHGRIRGDGGDTFT